MNQKHRITHTNVSGKSNILIADPYLIALTFLIAHLHRRTVARDIGSAALLRADLLGHSPGARAAMIPSDRYTTWVAGHSIEDLAGEDLAGVREQSTPVRRLISLT